MSAPAVAFQPVPRRGGRPAIAGLRESILRTAESVFAFDSRGITFFMLRDEPGSRLFWLSAAWLWFDYVRQTRRLRAKLPE